MHQTHLSRENGTILLPAKKMTFDLRGNGGNFIGAEWIAAEGEITDETADDLEAFMKGFGFTENPGGWSLRFSSPGGSLAGGIRLGELIRSSNWTLKSELPRATTTGHWKRVPGYCASACAFAFLGGLTRHVSGDELGVHQFYNEISIRDPSAKVSVRSICQNTNLCLRC